MGQLIHNRKVMEGLRRELRQSQTDAETILWEQLRRSQLEGRKFRRQHSVGVYVLDFYCPQERLAVEVDGGVHHTAAAREHDSIRDATLLQLAIRTLRIANEDVENDIESALNRIKAEFKTVTAPNK
jgi:very-short-patch-repair endonuclease